MPRGVETESFRISRSLKGELWFRLKGWMGEAWLSEFRRFDSLRSSASLRVVSGSQGMSEGVLTRSSAYGCFSFVFWTKI